MGLTCVIARELFTSFACFTNIGATEAIPLRVRRRIEVYASDLGDCHGLPPF